MRIVIVSNRVPVPSDGHTQPGGMTVGVQSALAGRDALWFGWSGRQDAADRPVRHITRSGALDYVTLDLPENDFAGYYNGFANQVLWPLFHDRLDLVASDAGSYHSYVKINALFAAELCRLLRPDDLIWIHDYHLIPLAQMLRERGVGNRIGFFLHTPFPSAEAFRTLPMHRALGRALLAPDLVGYRRTAT